MKIEDRTHMMLDKGFVCLESSLLFWIEEAEEENAKERRCER
jgi:hypothetical protein